MSSSQTFCNMGYLVQLYYLFYENVILSVLQSWAAPTTAKVHVVRRAVVGGGRRERHDMVAGRNGTAGKAAVLKHGVQTREINEGTDNGNWKGVS